MVIELVVGGVVLFRMSLVKIVRVLFLVIVLLIKK